MDKKTILGSHNSWSYLHPKKWWQKLIAFTARCQNIGMREQGTEKDILLIDFVNV